MLNLTVQLNLKTSVLKHDEDNYVLKDISFNVKPGQFIGLVGGRPVLEKPL